MQIRYNTINLFVKHNQSQNDKTLILVLQSNINDIFNNIDYSTGDYQTSHQQYKVYFITCFCKRLQLHY